MAGPPYAVLFAIVIAVAATLGLLHFLFWVFDRRDRQNLWFVALAGAFAAVAFLDYRERVGQHVVVPVLGDLQRYAVAAVVLAAARFGYSLVAPRAPRRFWLYLAAIVAVLALGVALPDAFDLPAGLLGLTVITDALVTLVRGWRRLPRGSWLVGVGSGLFATGGIVQLGLDLVGANDLADVLVPYVWGGLSMLEAISIYLARTFAATRRELERRLVEVEELSRRTLEQERSARDEEVRRRVLEAENERRGRELEEARLLQLAMSPRELPATVAGWEVAAAMTTATEVGGDYYDLLERRDGEAWLAVGDAVGHGARAGTLVAAAKSLFATLAGEGSPQALLQRFDGALRGMGLKRATLALTLARLTPGALEVASAGMPPLLLRRAATGVVEEVVFETLPLGAPLPQGYHARHLEAASGDLVVALSDGLVDLPGADGRPLGYDGARALVAAAPEDGGATLRAWVAGLARGLLGDVPPPDDVTIVALRAAGRELTA